MEQLTPFYDENISQTYFDLDQTYQGMDQNELNQFIQKLLTTIDLPKLTKLYFQQLKNTVQLSGLKIQFEDNITKYGVLDVNTHSKTLNCLDNGKVVAVMTYSFSQTLSIRCWQLLQQMHMYFSNPFKNALEHHKIKQFAMKDFLTSLGNRASYDEAILRLVSNAERHQVPFGLLMLDMDNFKHVNDSFGHHKGDKVLITCANTILKCLRESDFAFRFGGDEFCCLLPDADSQTNLLIAERIRVAIEENSLLKQHGISCSIGSATYQINDSQIGLFSRADDALYQAKQAGRNCVRND